MILFLCEDGFVESFVEVDLDQPYADGVALLIAVGIFTDTEFVKEFNLKRTIKDGDELVIENRRFIFNGGFFTQIGVFEDGTECDY